MKNFFTLIAANFLWLLSTQINAQTMQTIVGTGITGSYPALGAGANGDGMGLGINIQPGTTMCSDLAGNIYFADRSGKYARKWDVATRQVTTIAGNGSASTPDNPPALDNTGTCTGDGLAATLVNIQCDALCVTKDGKYLYIGENAYNRIRMVDLQTGIIGTLVGYNSGQFATYCSAERVNDDRMARFACVALTTNQAITIDNDNNLYLSDMFSGHRIRKVFKNPATGYANGNSAISTLAIDFYGSNADGISGFAETAASVPACTMIAGRGYLDGNTGGRPIVYKNNYIYFVELGSSGVGNVYKFRRMHISTLNISTIATLSSTTNYPSVNGTNSLAVDNAGNMYMVDLHTSKILRMSAGGVFSTYAEAGAGAITPACYNPYSPGTPVNNGCYSFASGASIITDYSGNLYFIDAGNNLLNKIDACLGSPTAITGPSSVCVGSTITLNNATAGGVWLSSLGRATVDASGNVTGTAAGLARINYVLLGLPAGCSNIASYDVAVSALPLMPSISYAAGTDIRRVRSGANFCTNRTFNVVGSPCGGAWATMGSLTNAIVDACTTTITTGAVAATTGTLNYTYTNASGCSNTRSISGILVNCGPRGIAALQKETIAIYPNPAHTTISVNINSLIGAGSILIADLYGKQVKTQALSLGVNKVDVSNLIKGMYLVTVLMNNEKQIQKIVVE